MSVTIYAADYIGRHLSMQLQREESKLHKNDTRKGTLISRGQNVSVTVRSLPLQFRDTLRRKGTHLKVRQ